jgi:hypothetical protein
MILEGVEWTEEPPSVKEFMKSAAAFPSIDFSEENPIEGKERRLSRSVRLLS